MAAPVVRWANSRCRNASFLLFSDGENKAWSRDAVAAAPGSFWFQGLVLNFVLDLLTRRLRDGDREIEHDLERRQKPITVFLTPRARPR